MLRIDVHTPFSLEIDLSAITNGNHPWIDTFSRHCNPRGSICGQHCRTLSRNMPGCQAEVAVAMVVAAGAGAAALAATLGVKIVELAYPDACLVHSLGVVERVTPGRSPLSSVTASAVGAAVLSTTATAAIADAASVETAVSSGRWVRAPSMQSRQLQATCTGC